jgi:CheY-like chemotaxis protein
MHAGNLTDLSPVCLCPVSATGSPFDYPPGGDDEAAESDRGRFTGPGFGGSEDAAGDPRLARRRCGPYRILVADDEWRIRLAVRACLETEGYEVEEACDGLDAISRIVSAPPDLLVLDLAMPNLDGLATLRMLATVYRHVAPRVLVLTAHGSAAAMEKVYEYGAAALLEKPLYPDVLRAAVTRVLRFPVPRRPADGRADGGDGGDATGHEDYNDFDGYRGDMYLG